MSENTRRDRAEPTDAAEENATADETAGEATRFAVDPVTRVSGGGGQALRAQLDHEAGTVLDSQCRVTLFRGYENVLEGRDARDAVDLASRVCGDTGVVHSLAASMAVEMAASAPPPPLAVRIRNMGQGAAFLYNLAGHLFLRAGPDYSATMLSKTNPGLLERAEATSALRADAHGYETVGAVMAALDPVTGDLYDETLRRARDVQKLVSLALGKFPHPSTAAPGGVTTTLDKTVLTQYFEHLKNLADFAKKVPAVWDDVLDFALEHHEGFADVGRRPADLFTVGAWDAPGAYDARYENADEWGRRRLSPPGVVVDGELRTTDLHAIDRGIEEFVDRSRYDDWTGGEKRFESTPAGGAIAARHPWNKTTRPAPEADADTWATAPRWDRRAMESGAIARQWVAARAGDLRHPLVESTGDGLTLSLPEVALPEATFRWDVPDRINAAERLRAEAYNLVYAGIACYEGLVETLSALKDGENSVHEGFTVPPEGTHRGVGLRESGRGAVTHHVVVEGGRLDTYQILTPSTWASSPTDPFGTPGPIETATRNTPILEPYDDVSSFSGVDLLRAVRSFDPCMVCAGQ